MRRAKTIAIIGGGLSGALTAYHLVRNHVAARVVVIEPRHELGLGLAYSTPSLQHLLNVPAGKISALPDQPDHFLRWSHAQYDQEMRETDFAPRAIFGKYIQSLVASVSGIEHLETSAVTCQVDQDEVILGLANHTTLVADAVVIATGNFDPAMLPGIAPETLNNGMYCHSAWEDATYAKLPPDAPVALIGSGLTAIDVILRLRELQHRGIVSVVSRNGRFPNRHATYESLPEPVISGKPPAAARELLRLVHQAIKAGAAWRAVVDSLRTRTNELWCALPLDEQRRFRRHLQSRWDVVRHRMAPSNAERLDAETAAGTVVHYRGSLHAVTPSQDGAIVHFRLGSEISQISAARVINCTGPDMNYRRVASPLLKHLFAQGLIMSGPLGGGLWTDSHGALRGQNGDFSQVLFNVGPGRLGTLLESIAVPELREQAVDLAAWLSARVSQEDREDVLSDYEVNLRDGSSRMPVDVIQGAV